MRFHYVVAATLFGAIGLAACGSGGSYSATSAPATPASVTPLASTQTVTVKTGTTSLGPVLVDGNAMTLYGRTVESNGMPTCVDACATAWPPLTVSGTTLPRGLDAKVFSVVSRPDGSHQLVAGKWPLYRFAGDAAPGDTNGQGSGGIWFVVTPSGALNKG